jgi:hypothetical protein
VSRKRPSRPTKDQIEAILELDKAAGSHATLLEWIAEARTRAKSRRGVPKKYPTDELYLDIIKDTARREGMRFETAARLIIMFGAGGIGSENDKRRHDMLNRLKKLKKKAGIK